eukprot:TRINITY_DN25181_c0_g1_i8.p1 TRINITY_DN25181_c0_g1~~TRINITY_DN25181_c0_g1_i8.p1  ORF type:complete len:836 (+),score=131.46 TRINITY_DN25181_c0_g1_i8:82-2589(+)
MRTSKNPRGFSERLPSTRPSTTTSSTTATRRLSLHTLLLLSLFTVAIVEGLVLISLLVVPSLTQGGGDGCGSPLAILQGADAAYDPTISIPYTDEFELLDSDPTHFGSFRLVTDYSSSGVMRGLRMRLNWTVVAGTSGVMAKQYNGSNTSSRSLMQDVYGNLYQQRSSSMGYPLVANITKGLPKMRFGVGNKGEAVETKVSMSEFSEFIDSGVIADDPRCSSTSYLCCPFYTSSYWRHTIINSGADLVSTCTRSLQSYEPGDVNPIDYRYSLGMTTSVLGTTTSTNQPTVSHTSSQSAITFTDAASTLTTTMKSTELTQIQSRPSRVSVCNRGLYTAGKTVWDFNEPFMVSYTTFGTGLKKIGIQHGVFKAERTCSYLPDGETVSLDRNTTDQFWYWDKQQWFGYPLGTTNNFVCDWGYDFTAATSTTPPIIGLTCNQPSITQNIVGEFNVLTQMFRPLHAVISYQGGTAVWDQRTKKIRISVRLWSAGEYSANITATVKSCTLEYDSIVEMDPITNTSLTDAPTTTATTTSSSTTPPTIRSKRSHTRYINASYAERVHLFLSSIHLPTKTPIGRQIGVCYVEVDVLNVKSSLSVFPELANIKVPLTSIVTNVSLLHRNKFRIDNPHTWREVFKKPVAGGYANIVPAQYNRRREHLRSRYRTNTLGQALLAATTRQQKMDAAYDKVSATDPFPNPSTPPLYTIYSNSTSTSSASYQQRSFDTLAVSPLTALPPGQTDPQAATINRYKIYRYNKRDVTSSLIDTTFPHLEYDEKMVDLVPDEPATYISGTNPLFKDDGTPRYAGTGITFPGADTTPQPGDGNNTCLLYTSPSPRDS